MPKQQKIFLHFFLIAALCALPDAVLASAFQFFEQSASSVATSSANQAEAKDVSAMFWNPAALTRVPDRQFGAVFEYTNPSGKFTGTSGQTTLGALPISGGDGGPLSSAGPINAFYYARTLTPETTLGVALNAPFGIDVDYDEGWVGRYHLLDASLQVADIGVSIGHKLSPSLSVGIGLDAQYAKLKFRSAIDLSTFCVGTALSVPSVGPECAAGGFSTPGNAAVDGLGELRQDSWSAGWNAGVLWSPHPDLRLGLAYRSKVTHHFKGDVEVTKSAALPATVAALPVLSNRGARTTLVLPESASASVFFQPSERWSVMANATWARWSHYQEIRTSYDNGAEDGSVSLLWKNTWRLSAGLAYQITPAWNVRAGAVFDQSPTTPALSPTLFVPDRDRHAFSLGGGYRWSEDTSIDFGVIHYILRDVAVEQNSGPTGRFLGTLTGAQGSVFSLQVNHRFK